MIQTVTFRGHEFRIHRGAVHPQYSIDCFTADESEFREHYWHPKAGDVVVDVGASYGAYSLTAAACGAKVIAFEPEPGVFVDLLANCALNPELTVKPECIGLWDDFGRVDMTSYAPHWPPGTTSGPFEVRRLDGYCLPKLDWLKVDVEGAEERVLKGALETLKQCRPVAIIECHVFLDLNLVVKCQALLESVGYNQFEMVDREPCKMLIARRRTVQP